MESRERDHFPRDLQPEGFLSFFWAFEICLHIHAIQPFLLLQQTITLHKLEMEKSPTFLPFFSSSLSGYCVSCPSECQVSVGNQIKLCDDLTDSRFWSACFFLWNPFQKIMGSKTVSDVNICLKAWQKKDYHPSTIGCRWKLESFIFCTGFCGKTVKPII